MACRCDRLKILRVWICKLMPYWGKSTCGKTLFNFINFLPICCITRNNAHWYCCCQIISNTCHLIAHTCCLPDETVVQWQCWLWLCGLSVHSEAFFSIPLCPSHLANLSLLLTLTLKSIFSFVMPNKCVTYSEAEWPAVCDPLCYHAEASASHLSRLIKPCKCSYTSVRPERGHGGCGRTDLFTLKCLLVKSIKQKMMVKILRGRTLIWI